MSMTIHQRMVEVLGELPAIGKDARNEQQNFMYRSHDDVLNALNPLLAKWGIVVVPEVLERIPERRQTRSGSVMYEVNLLVRYRFYGSDGDFIEASAWGEGTDSGDKATNKAMTMAFKNVLAQSFAVSTAESRDSDGETPEETIFASAEEQAARAALSSVLSEMQALDPDPAHGGDFYDGVAHRAAHRDFKKPLEQLGVADLTRMTHQFELALAALRQRLGEPEPSPQAETSTLPIDESVVRQENPPISAPKNWAELEALIKGYGEPTWEDFKVFMAQARDVLFPGAQRLSAEKKNLLLQKSSTVVLALLEQHGPGEFPPPVRVEHQAHWSLVLDGAVLPGPEWAMSPDEADSRPVREAPEPPKGSGEEKGDGAPAETETRVRESQPSPEQPFTDTPLTDNEQEVLAAVREEFGDPPLVEGTNAS